MQPYPMISAAYNARIDVERAISRVTWPASKYLSDPVGFARDILGYAPTAVQIQALEAARDHRRLIWSSGRRCGKSRFLATVALWWYATHSPCKVVLGAPCFRQVQRIVYQDLQTLWRGSGVCMRCRARAPLMPGPCPHSTCLDGDLSPTAATGLVSDDGRIIFGVAPEDSDAARGTAGKNLMVLLDEALSIDEEIARVLKDNALSSGGRFIAAGNPTTKNSWFYTYSLQKNFHSFTASCLDQPNPRLGENIVPGLVDWEWVKEQQELYQPTDPRYQVEVLGQFPDDTLARLLAEAELSAAYVRYEQGSNDGAEPLVLGIDPSGKGSEDADLSTVAWVRGRRVIEVEAHRGGNAVILQAVREGLRKYRRYPAEPVTVQYDASAQWGTDLGKDLYRLEMDDGNLTSQGLIAQGNPKTDFVLKDSGCARYRDAYWLSMCNRIRDDQIALPFIPELNEELLAVDLQPDVEGGAKVTDQRIFRKRLKRSPDRSNAVMYALWQGRVWSKAVADLESLEKPAPVAEQPMLTALDRADMWARASRDRLDMIRY